MSFERRRGRPPGSKNKTTKAPRRQTHKAVPCRDIDRSADGDEFTLPLTEHLGGVLDVITGPSLLPAIRGMAEDTARETIRTLSQEFRTCRVDECNRRTTGLGMLCDRHDKWRRLHGHELVKKPVVTTELAPAKRRVRAHMAQYGSRDQQGIDHPALIAARAWLDSWMNEARSVPERVAGGDFMKYLAETDCDVHEVFVAIIAMWLLAREHPNRWPDSNVLTCAVTFEMRRVGWNAARRRGDRFTENRLRGGMTRSARQAGRHIRSELSNFLNSFVDALLVDEEMSRRKAATKDDGSPGVIQMPSQAGLDEPFVSRGKAAEFGIGVPHPLYGMVGDRRIKLKHVYNNHYRDYIHSLELRVETLRSRLADALGVDVESINVDQEYNP